MAIISDTATPRRAFVQQLEAVIKEAEPTVQSLEYLQRGPEGEAVVIHYAATGKIIPIDHSSLLCVLKSVADALKY